MEFSRALAEIAEIHQQIAKGEVYRGYRSAPIAASGAIGLGAAWLQAPGLAASDPVGFVLYWAVVAIVAGFVGVSEIVYNYVVHDRASDRRRTRQVVGQFLPSMLGGAIITASFVHLSAALVPLLPGLWAICFGIGTFASRPYLPRGSTAGARPSWCSERVVARRLLLLRRRRRAALACGAGTAQRLVGRRNVRRRAVPRRGGVVSVVGASRCSGTHGSACGRD